MLLVYPIAMKKSIIFAYINENIADFSYRYLCSADMQDILGL